jgi:type 2 lantibiotic, mersacidin/lichenicidin family|nr:mersacidin/lichenicidin family type 2 lantibiotic [uncultured Steroidobacter sp.]
MKTLDIIRAWKDPSYRQSLTATELASLPANPAGQIELSDAELDSVAGGRDRTYISNNTCTINDNICCCSGPLCAPW